MASYDGGMLGLYAMGVTALCGLFGLFTLWAGVLLLKLRPWRDRTATLRRSGFTLTWGGVTAWLWGLIVNFGETWMGSYPAPEDSFSGVWQAVGAWMLIAGVALVLWAVALGSLRKKLLNDA